jgi:drug/metabolite transporter (DMT)-like permease
MSPRARRLLPYLSLLIVYLVWGSTYMAIRIVVREMPPFAAAALRFGIAGIVMAFIAAGTDRYRPTLRQVLHYALVGILLLAVANALVMWSEKRVPSGIAALVVACVPLWLTLLDGMRPGGRPWTSRVWIGTAFGLLGVSLVVRPEGGLRDVYWPGILALQVACVSWSVGSLYAQSVAQSVRSRLPLLTAAAVEMLAGSLVLAVESRLVGEDLTLLSSASRHAWLGLLYLAAFGSLVGFTAFAHCLNELPAATVGTYAYVNPIVAVALGSVFLGEPVSASLILGAGLILVAVLLSTTGRGAAAPRSSLTLSEEA